MEPTFTSSATYQWQVFNGTSWTNIAGATNATYTPSRGRRRQGAAGGGDLCRRCGGPREHDRLRRHRAGDRGRRSCGDARRTDRRQRGPGHGRQRDGGDATPESDVQSYATYQWQVFNGTSWTTIAGATNATYTPAEADEGKALQVVVTYADPQTLPGRAPRSRRFLPAPCRRSRLAILRRRSAD